MNDEPTAPTPTTGEDPAMTTAGVSTASDPTDEAPAAGAHRAVPPGGTAMLASDAERDRVIQRLQAAAVEGRLTLAESDERQAMSYAARTRSDLAPLVADLPRSPRPARPRRGPLSQRARWIFGAHAGVTAVIFLLLVVGWAVGPGWFFWPIFPTFWLGIALLVHLRLAERDPNPEETVPELLR